MPKTIIKKTATLLSLGLLGASSLAQADFIGLYVGAYHWQTDASGSFNSETFGASNIKLDSDLDLSDSNQNVALIAFEHPIPFLPNIKLQQTEIDFSGANQLNRNIQFKNSTFTTGSTVKSTVDLSHRDLALYYELFDISDNIFELDLGLTARQFYGEYSMSSGATREQDDINSTLPLLYAKAGARVPGTNFSLMATGNATEYKGSSIYDFDVRAEYDFAFGLGLYAGWREMNVELDDIDDISSDITFEGAYAGLQFHF